MLDHIILNRLKWWNVDSNANQVKLNNQQWLKCPKSFVFKNSSDSQEQMNGNPYTTCYGIGFGEKYNAVAHGKLCLLYDDGSGYLAQIPLNDPSIKSINWGGKHPLSHLYQMFKAITGKVVAVC
ncbi:hypothetical protein [uncultured Lactobacillus sp.]|uniref:hypothetical protein n=1 Tax=uncultured Lactobacillus sp. TaxID=153152 RepID=UPI00261351B1|nr:hypothetical protein [uncultured Lactobacillus sp.]